ASDLLDRLRDLVLLRAVPDAVARGLVSAPDDELAKMASQAQLLGPGTLTRYAEVIHGGLTEMRGATAPRLLLELLCSRMLLPEVAEDEVALMQRLERLERRISLGGSETALASSPASDRPEPTAPAPQSPARRLSRAAEPVVPTAAVEPQREPPSRSEAPQPAAPQPAAQPEPAASGLDATAVRRVWPEILAAVKDASRSVEAMLSAASVQSAQHNEIVLAHTAAPLVRRLSEPRNTDTVAAALRQVLGGDWRVSWVQAGAAAAGPQRQEPQRPQRQRPERAAARTEQRQEPQRPPEPDDVPPPPEPEDEDALLAAASRPPSAEEQAQQHSPEDEAVALLTEHLGAHKID
ncbi:MAG: DNA polymerase III subunit gamma/tau, partial [Sciscionella sp.]